MKKQLFSKYKLLFEKWHLYPSHTYFLEKRKERDYKYLVAHGVETKYGYVTLHNMPIINKTPNSQIKMENGVTLVSDPQVNPSGILHPCTLVTQSSEASIYLGKDSGMSGATLCCKKKISIGEYVGLGANVSIFDHDFHPLNPYYRKFSNEKHTICKEVIIEDFAWIGANSIILKGVHIGRGAVIGAGSVVTCDVPPLTVYAGNPARFIKKVEITEEQYKAIFSD
mgnify:CR=1 FL=1